MKNENELPLDLAETVARKVPAAPRTRAADFVLKFAQTYEAVTGSPYLTKRAHYVLATKLINQHGIEAVTAKVILLAALCRDHAAWFTSGGWSDFSIEKLSRFWNSILPSAAGESTSTKRAREHDAARAELRRKNDAINRTLGK